MKITSIKKEIRITRKCKVNNDIFFFLIIKSYHSNIQKNIYLCVVNKYSECFNQLITSRNILILDNKINQSFKEDKLRLYLNLNRYWYQIRIKYQY